MSSEIIPSAQGSQYALVEGKIYRGGELAATLQGDGSVDYAPDMARYRSPVVRFLKSLDRAAPDAGSSLGASRDEESEEVETPPEEQAALPSPSEVVPQGIEDTRTGAQVWAEEIMPKIEAAKRDWPEGAPATDFRGDKTPEFAEWYIKHYPERAALRYSGREFHLN